MFVTRSTRRWVANVAAALLLACQSAAVAQACCVLSFESSAAAQAPCHDSGEGNAGADGDAGEARCQQASASSPGISIAAADELPAMTAHFDLIAMAVAPVNPTEPPLLRVKPPPLAILHCCLRN